MGTILHGKFSCFSLLELRKQCTKTFSRELVHDHLLERAATHGAIDNGIVLGMVRGLAFSFIGRANVERVVLDVTELVLATLRRHVVVSEWVDEFVGIAAGLRLTLAVRGLHLKEGLFGARSACLADICSLSGRIVTREVDFVV